MRLDIIMLQCQEGFFSEEKSMTNGFEIIYFSISLTSAKNPTFYVDGLSSKLHAQCVSRRTFKASYMPADFQPFKATSFCRCYIVTKINNSSKGKAACKGFRIKNRNLTSVYSIDFQELYL